MMVSVPAWVHPVVSLRILLPWQQRCSFAVSTSTGTRASCAHSRPLTFQPDHGYITGTRSRNNSQTTVDTLLRRLQDVAHLNSPLGVRMTGAAVDELESITHPPAVAPQTMGDPRGQHMAAVSLRQCEEQHFTWWFPRGQVHHRHREGLAHLHPVLHAPETCPRVHTGLNPDPPKPRNSSHFRVAGTSGSICIRLHLL